MVSERRKFILGTARAAGLVALGGLVWSAYVDEVTATKLILRPPGALKEKDFLSTCIKCGMCVEACPFDALHMGSGFERALEKREDLVIPVDDLRKAEKTPSTWFRPQMEDKKYKPREKNAEIKDWHDVGRHEQPSDEDLTERWVNER